MAYKWELRRGSAKCICPACGQKRFVPYVLAADGKTLAGAEYGRCDREQNCGYHKYPSGVKGDGTIAPRVVEEKEPLRFYPAAVRIDFGTNLFQFACDFVGAVSAIEAWVRYKVGSDRGRTLFWQIDKKGEIRAGKSIPYGKDGHRIKEDRFPAGWVHKEKIWEQYRHGEELQQCFFGEHLLTGNEKPVAVVESEKTAVLMSCFSRGWVWLASGGSKGLKREEKLNALKGRRVLLIPDHGQYFDWAGTAYKNGWECAKEIEQNAVFEGCDILDMVLAGAFGADLLKNTKHELLETEYERLQRNAAVRNAEELLVF